MKPMDFERDSEWRLLAALPDYEPASHCRERIRARCHAALQAKRERTGVTPSSVRTNLWRPVFEFAAVAAVCAVYLSEVIERALVLYGL